jgi:putative transposase
MCPNQVWVADISCIRRHQALVYLAVIMDVSTQGIRGWRLGGSVDQELMQHRPEIHYSDQGVQYASTRYIQLLQHAMSKSVRPR